MSEFVKIDTHVSATLALLPEQFRGDPTINALLEAWCTEIQAVEDAAFQIIDVLHVDLATGDLLDKIGQIVGESREGRGDDLFKVFVKVRILINKSSGTIDELLTIFKLLEPTAAGRITEYAPASFLLDISDIAIDPLVVTSYGKILQQAKAATYSGALQYAFAPAADAFTFSDDTTPSISTAQGFSDVSQTTGGKMTGVIYG